MSQEDKHLQKNHDLGPHLLIKRGRVTELRCCYAISTNQNIAVTVTWSLFVLCLSVRLSVYLSLYLSLSLKVAVK